MVHIREGDNSVGKGGDMWYWWIYDGDWFQMLGAESLCWQLFPYIGDFLNLFNRSSIGWIPGLGIDITFFYDRFIYFKKLYLIQWIMLILRISKFWTNSLGNRFLKISLNFWKSVGGTNMRGFLILKIIQGVQLFTLINFI